MLEAEITSSGDVNVEGHHVGALEGFRFTADQTADGEDAKAVKTAAQKALATEFETRAERFANAANGDFALASDGLLRWIGAPVATLTSSDDPLSPRVILLADEQLTGPARDKVAARAERFVKYQIETLLKPLFDLKNAEQLTGIARGIAFRLVENFGLINRRDIADEVKSLDQEARAALRRLGVRFGAFHIFVPTLLKPAPAGLLTLLWSLQNDGKDKPGFGDVVNGLASGRTSLMVDASFEPAFYRLAGYRSLGRRAVRVDILERLADLIRPALAWRAGTGQRPEGAFDGAAFIVTPAMMSILGATSEDMEEILKGLGYRAEARPATDVQAKLDAFDAAERERIAAKEAAAAEAAAAPVEEAVAEGVENGVEAGQAADAPIVAETPATQEPVAEQQQEEAAAEHAVTEEPAVAEVEQAAAPAEDASAVAEEPGKAETPSTPDAPPAEEPKPILLWRPARFEGRQRQGQQRHGHNRGGNQQGRGQRREAAEGENQTGRDRPARGNFKGGKPHRGDHKAGGHQDRKNDRNNRPQGKPREERPVKLDPDSPFAKLAALRDQLKK